MQLDTPPISLRRGDTVTIEGVKKRVVNQDKKWWQFWKPNFVRTGELARFTVLGSLKEIETEKP